MKTNARFATSCVATLMIAVVTSGCNERTSSDARNAGASSEEQSDGTKREDAQQSILEQEDATARVSLPVTDNEVEAPQMPILPADTLPESIDIHMIPAGLPERPVPDSNPLTDEKVTLGRRLFFDPILSRDGTVACASCHHPTHGFATSDALAIGIEGKEGTRNAPSLLNRAYGKFMFWDGRSRSLEDQALRPITDPTEMAADWKALIPRLRADEEIVALFVAAFGDEGGPKTIISPKNVGRAIASFERTLLLGDSPVDAFHNGDSSALSESARRGLEIFEGHGGCRVCHSGDNYTDEQFHATGIGGGGKFRDMGRYYITNRDADKNAFKTPGLRSAALTPPYMHDGSLKSLRDVVSYYNSGGEPNDPTQDPRIQPLNLSEQDELDLVAFLEALSATVPR